MHKGAKILVDITEESLNFPLLSHYGKLVIEHDLYGHIVYNLYWEKLGGSNEFEVIEIKHWTGQMCYKYANPFESKYFIFSRRTS